MKAAEIFSQEFIRNIEEQLLHAKMPDDDLSIEFVDPLQFLSPDRIDLVSLVWTADY